MVGWFGPTEGDDEKSERFWNEMDKVEDRVGNGYRLCVGGSEWMDIR